MADPMTINLTPTPGAFRAMVPMFRESIARHREDIRKAKAIAAKTMNDLMLEGLDYVVEHRERAIRELEETVAEIEIYLEAIERGEPE
jgi:hypothetical protein